MRTRQQILDTLGKYEGDGAGLARLLYDRYGVQPKYQRVTDQGAWSAVADQIVDEVRRVERAVETGLCVWQVWVRTLTTGDRDYGYPTTEPAGRTLYASEALAEREVARLEEDSVASGNREYKKGAFFAKPLIVVNEFAYSEINKARKEAEARRVEAEAQRRSDEAERLYAKARAIRDGVDAHD